MVLEGVLDPLLSPLLSLPSWAAILVISAVITVITTLAYKYLTDQKRMKALKKEMKEYQKKLKKLSKEDPKKAMALQKEMMGKNMELMKHSFKPTLYTLIPLIIIFGWLNAHMAYHPLEPGQPFNVTLLVDDEASGNVTLSTTPALQVANDQEVTRAIDGEKLLWTLRGDPGDYQLTFTHSSGVEASQTITITSETGNYVQPVQKLDAEPYDQLLLGNEKVRPLEGAPLVGNWGWIGIYIVFSIALSFSLRKALGVA